MDFPAVSLRLRPRVARQNTEVHLAKLTTALLVCSAGLVTTLTPVRAAIWHLGSDKQVTSQIAQRCEPRIAEAIIRSVGGSTRLAGIAEVAWPAGVVPRGTRVQIAAICSPLMGEIFDETTAIFGQLARTSYAVRIAVAGKPSTLEAIS